MQTSKKRKKRNKTQYREDGTRIDTRTGRKRGTKKQTLPEVTRPKNIPIGLMQRLDGRTNLCKRFREEYDNVADDLGGEDNLSTIQRNTIERYVFLNELIRSWELQFAQDPESNGDLIGKLVQATNARKGLANDLGLTKKQQSKTTLQAYVAGGAPRD